MKSTRGSFLGQTRYALIFCVNFSLHMLNQEELAVGTVEINAEGVSPDGDLPRLKNQISGEAALLSG